MVLLVATSRSDRLEPSTRLTGQMASLSEFDAQPLANRMTRNDKSIFSTESLIEVGTLSFTFRRRTQCLACDTASRLHAIRRLGLLAGLRAKRKRNDDSRLLELMPGTITSQDADDHYLETRISIVAICIGKDRFCLRAVFS